MSHCTLHIAFYELAEIIQATRVENISFSFFFFEITKVFLKITLE